MASLFFSYSHSDERLRDQLEKQLSMLKRQEVIETWHDRRIGAGAEIDQSISEHVENDDVILLLVSPDFLASDYCYDKEMQRAMQRHDAGSAVVIPVILRACEWHGAPFGKLLATPTDGRPVTQWCVLLEGEYRFRAFITDIYAPPRVGLIIPVQNIEVDEVSAFDPGGMGTLGALVRKGTSVSMRVLVESSGFRQAKLLDLMTDLPVGSKDVAVAFSKWSLTVGSGEARRELFSIGAPIGANA